MEDIKNNNRCNIGDKVWWINEQGDFSCGIIKDIRSKETSWRLKEEFAYIEEEGRKEPAAEVKLVNCWPSTQELMRTLVRRSNARTREFREQIKTVTDLVYFMYTHDVVTDNKDGDAQAAVEEKAKELLGIDLSE